MTSLHEFLAKKRQERKRGKLAGLAEQIQKLKDLGATYKEIAEYLQLEHGIPVTRSGIQKHIKSVAAKRPAQPPAIATSPTPVTLPGPAAPSHPSPQSPPTENAAPAGNAFDRPSEDEPDRIQSSGGPSAGDVLARYDRTSPEHLAKVASLRQQRVQSKT